jgi:hypothetical protein
MRESLLRVGLELAEAFTGDSTAVADLRAAHPQFLVKLVARFAEQSVYSAAEISA